MVNLEFYLLLLSVKMQHGIVSKNRRIRIGIKIIDKFCLMIEEQLSHFLATTKLFTIVQSYARTTFLETALYTSFCITFIHIHTQPYNA